MTASGGLVALGWQSDWKALGLAERLPTVSVGGTSRDVNGGRRKRMAK